MDYISSQLINSWLFIELNFSRLEVSLFSLYVVSLREQSEMFACATMLPERLAWPHPFADSLGEIGVSIKIVFNRTVLPFRLLGSDGARGLASMLRFILSI